MLTSSTCRRGQITPYQQAVLDIIGITAQEITECGATVQGLVNLNGKERPGFRNFFKDSERTRRGAEHAERALRVRSRSRSRSRSPARGVVPTRDRTSGRDAPVQQGPSTEEGAEGEQAAVLGAKARELLRLFLRKYDLHAVEAGGETVHELLSHVERLEKRRAEHGS